MLKSGAVMLLAIIAVAVLPPALCGHSEAQAKYVQMLSLTSPTAKIMKAFYVDSWNLTVITYDSGCVEAYGATGIRWRLNLSAAPVAASVVGKYVLVLLANWTLLFLNETGGVAAEVPGWEGSIAVRPMLVYAEYGNGMAVIGLARNSRVPRGYGRVILVNLTPSPSAVWTINIDNTPVSGQVLSNAVFLVNIYTFCPTCYGVLKEKTLELRSCGANAKRLWKIRPSGVLDAALSANGRYVAMIRPDSMVLYDRSGGTLARIWDYKFDGKVISYGFVSRSYGLAYALLLRNTRLVIVMVSIFGQRAQEIPLPTRIYAANSVAVSWADNTAFILIRRLRGANELYMVNFTAHCCVKLMDTDYESIQVSSDGRYLLLYSPHRLVLMRRTVQRPYAKPSIVEVQVLVKNEDGYAVGGANVSIVGANVSTLTNAEGLAVLLVPAGNYTLRVTHTGYLPYAASLCLLENSSLVVILSYKRYNVTFSFLYDNGTAITGAVLAIRCGEKEIFNETVGPSEVVALKPGNYTAIASYQGQVRKAVFTVPGTSAVAFNFTSPRLIRLVFVNESGAALSGVEYVVADSTGVVVARGIANNGTVQLKLMPGTYEVIAKAPGYKLVDVNINVRKPGELRIKLLPASPQRPQQPEHKRPEHGERLPPVLAYTIATSVAVGTIATVILLRSKQLVRRLRLPKPSPPRLPKPAGKIIRKIRKIRVKKPREEKAKKEA